MTSIHTSSHGQHVPPLIEDVTLFLDDRPLKTLSPPFKLMYSNVLIADVTDYCLLSAVVIKVRIRFFNKGENYWCHFSCRNKKINLIGKDEIIFSGFSWSERDCKVKTLLFNQVPAASAAAISSYIGCVDNQEFVLSINIHSAIDKRNLMRHHCCRDEVDNGPLNRTQNDCAASGGPSKLIACESEFQRSKEVYNKNRWFCQGDLLQPLYILFYKRGGNGY